MALYSKISSFPLMSITQVWKYYIYYCMMSSFYVWKTHTFVLLLVYCHTCPIKKWTRPMCVCCLFLFKSNGYEIDGKCKHIRNFYYFMIIYREKKTLWWYVKVNLKWIYSVKSADNLSGCYLLLYVIFMSFTNMLQFNGKMQFIFSPFVIFLLHSIIFLLFHCYYYYFYIILYPVAKMWSCN